MKSQVQLAGQATLFHSRSFHYLQKLQHYVVTPGCEPMEVLVSVGRYPKMAH